MHSRHALGTSFELRNWIRTFVYSILLWGCILRLSSKNIIFCPFLIKWILGNDPNLTPFFLPLLIIKAASRNKLPTNSSRKTRFWQDFKCSNLFSRNINVGELFFQFNSIQSIFHAMKTCYLTDEHSYQETAEQNLAS